ncbi:SDR family NAD(P)-dependent oxidoreductase [Paraburkholderia caribensis]|uniref:SDR family NAD(P)-dependent oxidoreductase n=1 Tax=Paraburkholderia caribensis TaxID=75105 RepID=UPI000A795173|nr:SDR family NAD(P)-dependent oxidoreductase [Paraburkholderia caribensis]
MDFLMKGRTAIITGGVQGIGFEAAKELANEGVNLILADRNEEAGERALRALSALTSVIFVPTDLTKQESIDTLVTIATKRFKEIHYFVNSAAILDDKSFEDSSFDDWQRMLDVCLLGPMRCLHAILPLMKSQSYGRIVCFSSDSARVGQAKLAYYAAAKAGVTALVKSIAQEVGPHGITANIVSPGATNTPMRMEREASLREQMGPEKYAKRLLTVQKMYPLRRIGEPSDIAGMVTFLLSDRASWITGQVISINGGFTMV